MTKDKILQLCVKDIVANGWKGFQYSAFAQRAKLPVSEVYDHFPCRSDIPKAMIAKVDQAMLKDLEGETFEGATPREVLFEIIMTRLEAQASYKDFVRALWREWPADMISTLMVASQGLGSMGWILDRAGLNSTGLCGLMRLQGLTTLYLFTVNTWLEDDSNDLGKTMAFLDQGLGRVERIAKALNL